MNQNIQELQKKIKDNPGDISMLFKIAKSYEASNQLNDAIKSYQQIIRIDPSHHEVFFNLGLVLLKVGKISAAVNSISISIKIKPDFYAGYLKLAEIYEKQKMFDEADKYFQLALNSNPNSYDLQNDYGLFLKRTNQYELSEKIFRQLVNSEPEIPKYHGNLANVLQKQLKIDEALSYYNKAIELEPNYYEAIFSRSLVLLQAGKYIKGWNDYEVRWRLPYLKMKQLPKPLWQGEDISGKKLLVWNEQGFGDTIQMYRFLKILQEMNIHVIFQCQQELFRLFDENEMQDQLILEPNFDIIEYDFHVPMMSLPNILKIASNNIPLSKGYLEYHDNALPFNTQKNKLNIGFVWKGNVKFSNDINRSLSLEYFKQLSQNEHIQLYSMQFGDNPELKQFPAIIDLSKMIGDFHDLAKIIKNLDLIISVDTATIHLAGALGKKSFLLLPFSPDWRWGLEQSVSSWYDSVKIFRQKSPGDWHSVFDVIIPELNAS